MKRAEVDFRAQAGECRRLLRICRDGAADTLHQFHLRVADGHLLRVAAAAGTESRLLRRLREREEGDILALGAPRGTGGSTVDARRADRVDERAVRLRVAREDGVPLLVL